MSILEAFSTPLWSTKAPNHEEINKEFINIIPSLRTEDDDGVARSNAGGWHSKMLDIRTLPVFQKHVKSFLLDVNTDLNIKPGFNIIIDSLWININGKHNYNRTHTHPNSMISGVYYVNVPEGSGDLVLLDPRPQTTIAPFPVVKKNKYTTFEVRHHPQPGVTIAFPSWTPHYVEANQSDEERISVAFNIHFSPPN